MIADCGSSENNHWIVKISTVVMKVFVVTATVFLVILIIMLFRSCWFFFVVNIEDCDNIGRDEHTYRLVLSDSKILQIMKRIITGQVLIGINSTIEC